MAAWERRYEEHYKDKWSDLSSSVADPLGGGELGGGRRVVGERTGLAGERGPPPGWGASSCLQTSLPSISSWTLHNHSYWDSLLKSFTLQQKPAAGKS